MFRSLVNEFRVYLEFLEPPTVRLLRFSILIGVAAGVIEYGFVYILQMFLSTMGLVFKQSLEMPEWVPTSLGFVLTALLVMGFLRSFVQGAKVYLSRMASQTFFRQKRSRIVCLALELGPRISTSETLSVFTDETVRAGNSIMNFSSMISGGFSLLLIFSFALSIAPLQMTLGLVLLALLFIPLKKLSKYSKTTGNDIGREWSKTNDALIGGVRNHFFLNIYGLITQEQERADAALENYLSYYRKFILVTATKLSSPLFLGMIVIAALSFISVKIDSISGAIFLSFLYLFIRFVQTVGEVVSMSNDFRVHNVSMEKLKKWFSAAESLRNVPMVRKQTDESEAVDLNQVSHLTLELKNFEFKYPSSEKLLFKGINIKVKTGDCLVITGRSGSGKSTLLSLILGVLQPLEGKTLLNGEDIEKFRFSLRDYIGYVGPTPYIVEGTFVDNLLYGHPFPENVSKERIYAELKTVELYDFVKSLPMGLETSLDEVGSNISTGQRQRLSMARALLRRPKILILDEATSNLDVATERAILIGLKEYLPNMVTIAVSHRKALFEIATQKIDLDSLTGV